MSRPRIRSIKPETWQDEKIGKLTRDARLLFIGLITLADDEGRFRALPSVILGHVFPYDEDAGKRLERWLDELVAEELVRLYESDGRRYGWLPGWKKHQRINRPNHSLLPEPSLNDHGYLSEQIMKAHERLIERARPRARGGDQDQDQGSDRSKGRKGSSALRNTLLRSTVEGASANG